MKILELTNYSAGICGVWTRVREESIRLAERGHEVRIFSSNYIKGSDKIAKSIDKIDGVKIMRFPAKKLGGESYLKWDFFKDAIEFGPDIVLTHSYRHLHNNLALKLKNKIKCKVFLVTHAPFDVKDRGFISGLAVRFYDRFINKLNKFDKVIAITKWELPYLEELGLNKNKIEYVPNGIPDEFFKLKEEKEDKRKILFLGRISPVKNIEIVIKSLPMVSEGIFEIVGPAEETYLSKIKKLIEKNNLSERIIFSHPIYNIRQKIKKIDSARIFILPSKREAMPQSLIEAMSRGKIVIASDNHGTRELITNGENGFLFNQNNAHELATLIEKAFNENNKQMKKNAKESVKKFAWSKIIDKIDNLIKDN